MKKGVLNTIINFILVFIFLAGLSLLLYPTFSEYWNSSRQSRAITQYNKEVSKMKEEDYSSLKAEIEKYNQELLSMANVFVKSEEQKAEYERLLNVSGNGIMAYVEIPKIKCSLPVYHGTSEAVLQVAIGHLDWTSLPLGGKSTHSVFSGHRGLPSARLFTDLDKMEIGDRFYIRVLNEVLTYEVDQILVVLPEETDDLRIVEGEDYCTLFTCTPYAVNTHRLLVRGKRVETVIAQDEAGNDVEVSAMDLETLEKQRLANDLQRAVIVVGAIVVIMLGLLIVLKGSKKKKKRGGDANEDK